MILALGGSWWGMLGGLLAGLGRSAGGLGGFLHLHIARIASYLLVVPLLAELSRSAGLVMIVLRSGALALCCLPPAEP